MTFAKRLISLRRYQESRRAPRPRSPNDFHLIEIEFDPTDRVGILSDPAAEASVNWPGLTLVPCWLSPDGWPKPKRESGLSSDGKSGVVTPISESVISFQDTGGALSDLIANRRANGKGLRGRILRYYRWPATRNRTDDDLEHTWQLSGDENWHDGARKITVRDIRRNLKKKILEPLSWRLQETLEIDATEMTLVSEEVGQALPFYQHHDRYSSEPGETIFYVRFSQTDEIVGIRQASEISPGVWRCTNLKRAALRSKAGAISVSADTEVNNRPEAKEWIYYEEQLSDFIPGLVRGYTIDGNRQLPAHWHCGTDAQWIDAASVIYAAEELATMTLRLENYGGVEAKKLLETEILNFIGCILRINRRGALELFRRSLLSVDAGGSLTFDSRNVVQGSVGPLKTVASRRYSAIGIRAGWDARSETFQAPVYLVDPEANSRDGDAEPLILESKLLHSSIATNAQIKALLPELAEYYLHPRQELPFQALPSTATVQAGERVRIDLWPRDSYSGADASGPIQRSVLVDTIDEGAEPGVGYKVIASSGKAPAYLQYLDQNALDDAWYEADAIDLGDVVPAGSIQLSGGIYYLSAGQYPISLNQKYTFGAGPFYMEYGAEWVPIDNGPYLFLAIPHAFHADGPTIIDTRGHGLGYGGAPGELGSRGFAVPVHGVGSMHAHYVYDDSSSSGSGPRAYRQNVTSEPGRTYPTYKSGAVPYLALSNNDGILQGLPADLSGFGGVGGMPVSASYLDSARNRKTEVTPGLAGAAPPAGVLIIARGVSFGVNAKFNVSGSPSPEQASIKQHPDRFLNGPPPTEGISPGSGSGPATIIIGIDGNNTAPVLGSQHVDAYAGETRYAEATRAESANETRLQIGARRSHYDALDHTVNMADACTRVLFIPAPAKVQEKPAGLAALFEGEFAKELHRLAEDVKPTGGNDGDLAIWVGHLYSDDPEPPMWYKDNGVWVAFQWNGVRKLLGRIVVDGARTSGATHFYFRDTPPTRYQAGSVFINSETFEVLFADEANGVWQSWMNDAHDAGETILSDPYFTKQVGQLQHHWSEDTDRWRLPSISDTPTGSATGDQSGGFAPTVPTLPSPSGFSFTSYSSTAGELFWTKPNDMSNTDGFRVTRNGEVIATADASSLFMDDLEPGVVYVFTLQGYNAGGEVSATLTVQYDPDPASGTGGGGGDGGTTYSIAVTVSTLDDGNGTPKIAGTATGFEGRGVWITSPTDGAVGFGSTNVDANGDWQATPPAGLAAQELKAYISNQAGDVARETLFDYPGP